MEFKNEQMHDIVDCNNSGDAAVPSSLRSSCYCKGKVHTEFHIPDLGQHYMATISKNHLAKLNIKLINVRTSNCICLNKINTQDSFPCPLCNLLTSGTAASTNLISNGFKNP